MERLPRRGWFEAADALAGDEILLQRAYVSAQGGGLPGSLISRDNLISQVNLDGGMNGLIAVQGDVGAAVGSTRLGGIESNGTTTGDIVVLGNVWGDSTFDDVAGANAIAAIFTNGGLAPGFDVGDSLDLQGLGLILHDLEALTAGASGTLTGTAPGEQG